MQNNHGGPRSGAGRKKGSSVYGESTRAIRVPESLMPTVRQLLDHRKQHPSLEKTMTDSFLHPAQNPKPLPVHFLPEKSRLDFRLQLMTILKKHWI